MSGEIRVEILYSEHEFVRGKMFATHRVENTWFSIGVTMISLLVGFGFSYWFLIRNEGPIAVNDLIVGAVAIVVSIPLAIGIGKFKPSNELVLRKIYQETPALRESCKVLFDQAGIESSSDSMQLKVKWDDIVNAYESDDDFFFLLSDHLPIYFPKRAFTPQQMVALREMSRRYMNERAKFLH